MIRMAVLGSGSAGNSTLLSCEKTHILVDAGLSAKQLVLRMQQLGLEPEDLDAIILTHEHSDHARGIDVLLRNRNIPVFANAMTREALSYKMKSKISWKVFRSGQEFTHGDFSILSFKIPHDAAEPVGFTVKGNGTQIGMVSDIGHITPQICDALRGCDAIYVEANYDEALLESDTKRPWSIKQRIQSHHGHLSNLQTAELLNEVACDRLKVVMLCHLSSDCNCPNIAEKAIRKTLSERGLKEVAVHCAEQHHPSNWIEVGYKPVEEPSTSPQTPRPAENPSLEPEQINHQDDFFLKL